MATVPCSPRSFTTRERPQTPDKAHMVACQSWCESRLVTALPACDTALPPLHSTDWGEVCHGEEHCLEPSCPRTNGVASCSHSVNHGGVPPATRNAGTERMRCDSSPTPQPTSVWKSNIQSNECRICLRFTDGKTRGVFRIVYASAQRWVLRK